MEEDCIPDNRTYLEVEEVGRNLVRTLEEEDRVDIEVVVALEVDAFEKG